MSNQRKLTIWETTDTAFKAYASAPFQYPKNPTSELASVEWLGTKDVWRCASATRIKTTSGDESEVYGTAGPGAEWNVLDLKNNNHVINEINVLTDKYYMRGIEFVDDANFNFKTIEFDDPTKSKSSNYKV